MMCSLTQTSLRPISSACRACRLISCGVAGAPASAKGVWMRFHDKVALITAAASGIGRATADIMASEGGVIVAVDNNEERLDRAVAQVRAAGGRAHRRLCNALDERAVAAT